MSNFSDFKKRSKSSIEDLTKKIEDLNKEASYKDDRFWKPEVDKAGNGYAVIRFLPAAPGEDIPWAKVYSHAFQGKGGWLIENCPTTIGQKCPICEGNSELWNSGIEKDKDIARNRKRKLSYISNILVVSDPANPANDGKMFLYKYGTKIFGKIQEAMQPQFKDEEAINPFDFWKGANFKLKIRKVAGFINYDKSEFDSQSELYRGDDEKLELLWKNLYKLNEFVNPSEFKNYEDLKKKMNDVLGGDLRDIGAQSKTIEDEDSSSSPKRSGPSDSEDAMAYFERLSREN